MALSRILFRALLPLSAAAFPAAASGPPPPANRDFNLPAESAEQSLKALSRASGVQILFATETVAGVQTRPLKGNFIPLDAATRLLEPTELEVRLDDKSGALIVQRRKAPGDPLPRATPEAEGVPSAAVEDLVKALDGRLRGLHSFMLLRHGAVIAEGWWAPHSPAEPHLLYSLSKSFTSAAVGFAIAEGKLHLEDSVLQFFPEDAPASPGPHLQALRVRDLLTLSSGHYAKLAFPRNSNWLQTFLAEPSPLAPGEHFFYEGPAVYTLSAIIQKITGQTLSDYLQPRLFAPLGIARPTWDLSPQGVTVGESGLYLCTEDIAKFGQLYLQKGNWHGRQLLPAAWVEASTSKEVANDQGPAARHDVDSRQGYGYLFWMIRHGGYMGAGSKGQFCIVLPGQDVVVAITAKTNSMQNAVPVFWDHLLPVLREAPLPADDGAVARLRQMLSALKDPAAPAAATLTSALMEPLVASSLTRREELGPTLGAGKLEPAHARSAE